jgi:hypothetical protein
MKGWRRVICRSQDAGAPMCYMPRSALIGAAKQRQAKHPRRSTGNGPACLNPPAHGAHQDLADQ